MYSKSYCHEFSSGHLGPHFLKPGGPTPFEGAIGHRATALVAHYIYIYYIIYYIKTTSVIYVEVKSLFQKTGEKTVCFLDT